MAEGNKSSPAIFLRQGPKLGEGSYGAVHAVEVTISYSQRSQPTKVSPRLVHKTGLVSCPEVKDALQREAAFLRHVYGDPARVSFSPSNGKGEWYSLICQRVSGQTASNYLVGKTVLANEYLKVLDAILAKLNWLHKEKQIIHGDLQPENIMVNKVGNRYEVNLIDFGFSYSLDESAITLDYDAEKTYFHPDRCRQRDDLSADVWHDVYSLIRSLLFLDSNRFAFLKRVLPLYNVGYIAAGTPKSLTFSQN